MENEQYAHKQHAHKQYAQLSVRLEKDPYRVIKMEAIQQDKSMAQVIKEALNLWLESHEKPKLF